MQTQILGPRAKSEFKSEHTPQNFTLERRNGCRHGSCRPSIRTADKMKGKTQGALDVVARGYDLFGGAVQPSLVRSLCPELGSER